MKTPNRDLLVLVKDEFDNEISMERELERLNRLLYQFETLDTIASRMKYLTLIKEKSYNYFGS